MMPIDKDVIARFSGYILGVPKWALRSVMIASLSLVQEVLGLIPNGLVEDIRLLKEDMHRKNDADTAKKMAEAVDAANKAALGNRNDAIAKIQEQRLKAQAVQAVGKAQQAVAKAKDMRVETQIKQQEAEARLRLFNALTQLKEEGGKLMVDPDELAQFMQWTQQKAKQLESEDSGEGGDA